MDKLCEANDCQFCFEGDCQLREVYVDKDHICTSYQKEREDTEMCDKKTQKGA